MIDRGNSRSQIVTLDVGPEHCKQGAHMPKKKSPLQTSAGKSLVVHESIAALIHLIRGQKVMLDSDLAALYGVETKSLVRAMKRHRDRFPTDFMFQLTAGEFANLRSQFGTSSQWGGRRYPPYAFTEHGAVMLASVLNSPRAIEASIYIVRAFVRMRELVATHKDLAAKIRELERKVGSHDESIRPLVAAIRQLIAPPPSGKKGKIGFGR